MEALPNDMTRANVGCGRSPTQGWRNFDNSQTIKLAKVPLLPTLLRKIGVLSKEKYEYVQCVRANHIEYADATRKLPVRSGSLGVLYSSHMIEHLDQKQAASFLQEARRVLCSGGLIRLVIPDIQKQVQQYIETNKADAFVAATGLAQPRATTLAQRAKLLLLGSRGHQWMYDGESLSRLLEANGFVSPAVLDPGTTTIGNPQGLDLRERCSESAYVEARTP
ncbi:MAG: methyltransferase domain-containing protein [Planctomycetota bacterium]